MSDFTPGPWRAKTDKNDMPHLLYYGLIACLHHSPDPDGYVAVVTDGRELASGQDERGLLKGCQANAHLIAAAPELYRMLSAAVEESSHAMRCTFGSWKATNDERATCTCWIKDANVALAAASPPPADDDDGAGVSDGSAT